MTDFEREDTELQEMFHGEEKPMHPDTVHVSLNGASKPTERRRTAKASATAKNTPKEEKPVNAQWEPAKPKPNDMDRLKKVAKETGMYAALSLILFWWQQTGRLDETTAWYALLVCVGMVFFTIGKTCSGVNK